MDDETQTKFRLNAAEYAIELMRKDLERLKAIVYRLDNKDDEA